MVSGGVECDEYASSKWRAVSGSRCSLTSVAKTTSSTSAAASAVPSSSGPTEALGDRVGQRVVVEPTERKLPHASRAEHVVGLQLEHERLELVEPVEGGHRPGHGACRRPVDPPDSIPERRLAQPLQEPELEEHAVDPASGEDERGVARIGIGHAAIVPPWSQSLGGVHPSSTRRSRRSSEELWQDDEDTDRAGWFCVSTDPFPCPAEGCSFVAEFMTAAHLVLVWEERDDPNLLWHAQRAKEVGRNPARRLVRDRVRPERLVLRLGGGGTTRARGAAGRRHLIDVRCRCHRNLQKQLEGVALGVLGRYGAAVSPEAFQPGGRAPAPPPLDLVQDFVNTEIPDFARDDIATPAELEAWLRGRGLLAAGEALDAETFVAARGAAYGAP